MAEINNNLDVFQIFYLLLMDVKSKYNLNNQNYNRLTITLRILMVTLIYYILPIVSISILSFEMILLIKTNANKRLMLLTFEILLALIYFICLGTLAVGFMLIFKIIL